MPKNRKSQTVATFIEKSVEEAQAAERTSSVMSTTPTQWICPACKLGCFGHERACPRCATMR